MTIFTVTNDLTTGSGSLREAILDANALTGADVIEFDNTLVGPVILLGASNIDVTGDLTIDGDWNNDGISDFMFRSLSGSQFFNMTVDGTTLTLDHFALDFDASGTTQDNAFAIQMSGNNQTFINNDTINVVGYDGNLGDRSSAIRVDGTGATIDNSGTMVSTGRHIVNATQFSPAVMTGEITTVINSGLMEATDDAVRLSAGTVTNSGTIRTTGTFDFGGLQTAGISADAISVFGDYDPNFTHSSGGVVTINNSATGLVDGYRSGIIISGGGEINNDGIITALGTGILSQGSFVNGLSTTFALNNTGSIFRTNVGDFPGFSGITEQAAVMIGGGNDSNTIFNSGTISSTSTAISASDGVSLTNTATGIIASDNDMSGNDGVAFSGAQLTDFEVTVSQGFAFLDSSANYISAQGITILANGNWNIPGSGDFAPPNSGQVDALFLSFVDAPTVMALVDVAASFTNGFITFQSDVNGTVFPSTLQVPTTDAGTVTVTWVSGVGATVTDANGDSVFNPIAGTNYADTIDNQAGGQILGDVYTGLGDDTITNAGLIDGDVYLGVGDDVYASVGSGSATSVDGGAGNDTITVGMGVDGITGGSGADLINTSATAFTNSEAELNGDTITDFSIEDLITFNSAFNLVDSYDFTNNGDGTGTLALSNGQVLNFTGLSVTDDIVVISDRVGLEEIRMLDNGVLNLTLDHDYFDFFADVAEADITILAGTTVGDSPLFPGQAGRLDLDFGTDYSINNAGNVTGGISLQSDVSSIVNTGDIRSNISAISVSETNIGSMSSTLITNDAMGTITGVNGIVVQGGGIIDASSLSIDNTTIVNDGTITAYFTAMRAGATDTLDITNNGTISTVANPNAGPSSSQGLVLSGNVQTNLTNTGVIEVTSSFGGLSQPVDGVAVLGSGYNGDGFTLTNSGRISSTGSALMIGGLFDEDDAAVVQPDFVTTITNTSTGIIEADTNNSNNSAEYAITGTSGGFILTNTPDAIYEGINRFAIDNAGLITGNISLYEQDYFLVEGQVFFPFNPNGPSIAEFQVPGAPNVQQDLDGNGDPIYDTLGQPVFTPGSVTSTFYGVVNYSVDPLTNRVTLTDANGDVIYALPDTVNIDAGGFNDTVDNSGTIDGNVHLGIGQDDFINTGTVTGDIMLGLGDDIYNGQNATVQGLISGGDGADWLYGGAGVNNLSGGSGRDVFAFSFGQAGNVGDVVSDYSASDDVIYLGGTASQITPTVDGADVLVAGVRLTGAANGNVTVITQLDTSLLSGTSTQDLRSITSDNSFTQGVSDNYNLAGNFVATIHDVNDDQSFSKDIFVYTSDGLDFRFIENDDGGSLLINYDQTNGNSYDVIATTRNTASEITNTVTTLDGGSFISTFFDVDGVQVWSQATNGLNSVGVLSYQDQTLDSGVRILTDYDDLNDKSFTTKITQFAANGDVIFVRNNFDTGRNEVVLQDYLDENVWDQKVDSYDVNGLRDFVTFFNDDGSRIIEDTDQAGDQAFSISVVSYNAANIAVSQNTTFDNGTRSFKAFDADNSQVWTQITNLYDFAGLLDSAIRINDDGTRVVTNFDQNDDFSWSQNIITFDNNGDLVSDVFI